MNRRIKRKEPVNVKRPLIRIGGVLIHDKDILYIKGLRHLVNGSMVNIAMVNGTNLKTFMSDEEFMSWKIDK